MIRNLNLFREFLNNSKSRGTSLIREIREIFKKRNVWMLPVKLMENHIVAKVTEVDQDSGIYTK